MWVGRWSTIGLAELQSDTLAAGGLKIFSAVWRCPDAACTLHVQATASQKPQKHLIDATPAVMPRHARFGSGGSAPDVGTRLSGSGGPVKAESPARLQQPADPDETLNAALRSVVRRSEQSAIKRAPRPPAGKENQAS